MSALPPKADIELAQVAFDAIAPAAPPRWPAMCHASTPWRTAALLLPQLVHSAFICNAPLFRDGRGALKE